MCATSFKNASGVLAALNGSERGDIPGETGERNNPVNISDDWIIRDKMKQTVTVFRKKQPDEEKGLLPQQNGQPDETVILRQRLMDRLEYDRDLTDEEILQLIDEVMTDASAPFIRLSKRSQIRWELFNSMRRLDILQELLDDNSITEIMVNGMEGIFIERKGMLQRWEKSFGNQEKIKDIVQQIVAGCNRVANESSAIVDARLPGGARVNAVMPPIALNGPIITIRRFPDQPIRMEELIAWNSISEEASGFLCALTRAKYSIFISGGTGSGKTTFLNALSNAIPKEERIITIEDNSELQIQNAENLVRLEARRANEEGEGEITIRDLIRTSLRMRPDRIIVGEVRGEETLDMLQALNTGHDGSLSTGHGNSPRDMLSRLEMMVLMGTDTIPITAIRRQISSGIDIMVHLSRMRDKSRKVMEILEIDGYDVSSGEILTHTLFEFTEEGEDENGRILGQLRRTGTLKNREKLKRAGIKEEKL